MRTLVLLLCGMASGIAQQSKSWYDNPPVAFGASTDVWQLALSSGKQGYLHDEPVWVKLVARNNGTKVMRVGMEKSRWMVADFKIARIPGGEVLKLRPYRNHFEKSERLAGGTVFVQVQPGSSVSPGTVNLQTLFDLTPGTYTVTATRRFPSADAAKGEVLVSSNQLTISIVAH